MYVYVPRRAWRRFKEDGKVKTILWGDTPVGNMDYVRLDVTEVEKAKGSGPATEPMICTVDKLQFNNRQLAGVHAGSVHALNLDAAIERGVIVKRP